MLTVFYKTEISNIMNEMIRIIDRLNELTETKSTQLEWPLYCDSSRNSRNDIVQL